MNPFLNNALLVRILWAFYNQRQAGDEGVWPAAAHSLWWMTEGEVQLWSGAKCWTVRQGQIVLWPKNRPRRIVSLGAARWLSIGLAATDTFQRDLLSSLELPGVHTFDENERLPIVRWMENLLELDDYESDGAGVEQFSGRWPKTNSLRPAHFDVVEDSMARALFGWCWGQWGTVDLAEVLGQQLPLWLQKTLDSMSENPQTSIAQLARMSNFSPAQFRRLFGQHMKKSPQQYLLDYRLERAQHLLLTTNLPIDEVAIRSGFATPTHFMKQWKRARGMSALQYRSSFKRFGQ